MQLSVPAKQVCAAIEVREKAEKLWICLHSVASDRLLELKVRRGCDSNFTTDHIILVQSTWNDSMCWR